MLTQTTIRVGAVEKSVVTLCHAGITPAKDRVTRDYAVPAKFESMLAATVGRSRSRLSAASVGTRRTVRKHLLRTMRMGR